MALGQAPVSSAGVAVVVSSVGAVAYRNQVPFPAREAKFGNITRSIL